MIASLISHNVFYYKYTTPNELISLIFLSFVLFFFLAGSKIHKISMFLNKLVESFIWDSFSEICRHSTNTNWKFFFRLHRSWVQQRSDLIDGILKTEICALNLTYNYKRLAVQVDRVCFYFLFFLSFSLVSILMKYTSKIHTDFPPMRYSFSVMC